MADNETDQPKIEKSNRGKAGAAQRNQPGIAAPDRVRPDLDKRQAAISPKRKPYGPPRGEDPERQRNREVDGLETPPPSDPDRTAITPPPED